MDTVDPIRFISAFIFILALIGIMAFALKRFGKWKHIAAHVDNNSRIQVVENRYLDTKRKLVLVKYDDSEHLILIADGREMIIESRPQNTMTQPNDSAEA